MEKLSDLSRGSKLVLAAGPLLFFSLFFTWQNVKIDYGAFGSATLSEDGWDGWGLLVGLGVVAIVTLVVLRHLTQVELSEAVPWEAVILALGTIVLALTLVKNVTDPGSSLASYGFVVLAGALALGTYLSWDELRDEDSAPGRRNRRDVSSAV